MPPVSALKHLIGRMIAQRFPPSGVERVFEFSNLTMTDLSEVCSLGVKTPNQSVGMLIQATLLGMVRPRNKLAEGIGFNVSESGNCSGQLILATALDCK